MRLRVLSMFMALFVFSRVGVSQTGSVGADSEVAAVLYGASATLAAFQRAADADIRAQRDRIDALRSELSQQSTATDSLQYILTEAETHFVAALAEKDRVYAMEIAAFRHSLERIVATPEGAEALAQYNAGDKLGAIAILEAIDQARDRVRNVASAVDKRSIAFLSLEARSTGTHTTSSLIRRFEEITRLDPDVFWDWVLLGRLYEDAGDLPGVIKALQEAQSKARSDWERSVVLEMSGTVHRTMGNLEAAFSDYSAVLSIRDSLVTLDPTNAFSQHDLAASLIFMGHVFLEQDNLKKALDHYGRAQDILSALVDTDPANTSHRRGLAIADDRVGDVYFHNGQLETALAFYYNAWTIREDLTNQDPDNATWKRELSISMEKIGDVESVLGDEDAALAHYHASRGIREELNIQDASNSTYRNDLRQIRIKLLRLLMKLQAAGTLNPTDAPMIDTLKRQLGE